MVCLAQRVINLLMDAFYTVGVCWVGFHLALHVARKCVCVCPIVCIFSHTHKDYQKCNVAFIQQCVQQYWLIMSALARLDELQQDIVVVCSCVFP